MDRNIFIIMVPDLYYPDSFLKVISILFFYYLEPMGKRAIVAGATGLIGSQLLDVLLAADTYDEVLILVRKKLDITHPILTQLVTQANEVKQFHLVSSIGANPNSGTFYIKLKGETERAGMPE